MNFDASARMAARWGAATLALSMATLALSMAALGIAHAVAPAGSGPPPRERPAAVYMATAPAIPTTYARVDTSGTPAAVYRLPAMVTMPDDTLVACYDSRNISGADLPNNIDVVCRRSTDRGLTWSARSVAARHSDGDTPATAYGVGDPQLTLDRVTGRLFMHYLAAPPGIGYGNSSTSATPGDRTTVHPLMRYSDDGGVTWSGITDLTRALKGGGIQGIFASGGRGFQLGDGTLMAPYAYRINGVGRAAYAFSTDHGTTWRMGPELGLGVDEHHGVQLDDGTLLDNGRSADGSLFRKLSTAATPTAGWTPPRVMATMPDPRCNGDMIRVTDQAGHERSTWLLASNPDSQTSRQNLVVRLSKDNGATWPYALTIESGPAGYSTLVRFGDGSFGVLYENAAPNSLKFARFTVDGNFPA